MLTTLILVLDFQAISHDPSRDAKFFATLDIKVFRQLIVNYLEQVIKENPDWYPDTERELKKHDGKTPLGK